MNTWQPFDLHVEMISASVPDRDHPGRISLELMATIQRLGEPLDGIWNVHLHTWKRDPSAGLCPHAHAGSVEGIAVTGGRLSIEFSLSRDALMRGAVWLELSLCEHGHGASPVPLTPLIDLSGVLTEELGPPPSPAVFRSRDRSEGPVRAGAL